MDLTGKIYTDQTGWFPIPSSKYNKYILVAYHYDSNTIYAESLKTRTGLELKSVYHKIHTLLTNRGLQPSLHILDNECHNVLNTLMREVSEKFQSVPPDIHHRNSEKPAIQNCKDHFISGLVSTHNNFLLYLWCRLIPHASPTLNLFHQ